MLGGLYHWVHRGRRENHGIIPWTDNGCMRIPRLVVRLAGNTLHFVGHQQGQFNVDRFCEGYIWLFESFGISSQSSCHQDSNTMQTSWYPEENHDQLQQAHLWSRLCTRACTPRQREGLSSPQQALINELYCRYPCKTSNMGDWWRWTASSKGVPTWSGSSLCWKGKDDVGYRRQSLLLGTNQADKE